MGVTRALGASVVSGMGASARVVNYRKNGEPFLNHISFDRILDTESSPENENGVNPTLNFWAVLKDIGDEYSNLELLKGPQGQRQLPISLFISY